MAPARARGAGRGWLFGLAAWLLAASFPACAAQIALAWDPSTGTGVTGYYVYYGTASRNYPSRVNAGTQTSYTINNLAAGQTYYFAVTAYNPSGAESSYSNEASTTIAGAPSQTQLGSSLNPAPWSTSIAFTATVTGASPTGTVGFTANGATISGCGAVALTGSGNAPTAICATTSLAVGSYSVVANYSGNGANAASSSPALAQAINKVTTTTTLAGTPNPSAVGASIVFTATVTGIAPTGTVAFTSDGTPISGCSARSLSGAGSTRSATCSTSALTAGIRAIGANYAGNANNQSSLSGAYNQVVYSGSSPPTATFSDVPVSHWAWSAIEAVAAAGVSLGCGTAPARYCPEELVGRDAMAVFLERATRGLNYPYAPTGTRFADVPITHWAVGPIEQAYLDGITLGCATGPLRFCPDVDITRAQMAAFLLRAKFGGSYNPGTATGLVFSDVPASHPAAAWIERFASLGYTTGCGTNPARYCPDGFTSRAAMAVFMQRVFAFPVPTP